MKISILIFSLIATLMLSSNTFADDYIEAQGCFGGIRSCADFHPNTYNSDAFKRCKSKYRACMTGLHINSCNDNKLAGCKGSHSVCSQFCEGDECDKCDYVFDACSQSSGCTEN